MTKRTVLYDEHERLGARIVDFHGWMLPVQYDSILAEHKHCRDAACVFDTSHMGLIRIIASQPEDISRVLTQDAAALRIGKCQYGFILNQNAGIMDDTILTRLGENEFLLVVNAGTQTSDLEWLIEHLSPETRAVSLSEMGWAKMDIQGPAAADVLEPMVETDIRSLKYFRGTKAVERGTECIISRTGYTGELGYEIFAPGELIVELFREAVANPRIKPAGLGARDSLRLEMGYPLYGEDIDATTTPVEAGLGFFIRRECGFIGAEALENAAPERVSVAFMSAGRKRAWPGDDITLAGEKIGSVTSAAFAPSLNVAIGMGYVSLEAAGDGTEINIATKRGELPATITPKPLYTRGTCRTKHP